MPGRQDAKNKYKGWSLYFATAGASTCKSTLRKLIGKGHCAKVTLHQISACRVDCVWPRAVTYDSAARFVTLAKEANASFEILGLPKPVREGNAESAGKFGVADSEKDGDGGCGNCLPDISNRSQREANKKKKKQSRRSGPEISEVAPQCKQAKETPGADDPPPATQGATQAASAFEPPPSHLLYLKAMTAADRLEQSQGGDDSHKYSITSWGPLGEGSYGKVYDAISREAVPQRRAIKLFHRGAKSSKEAMNEVARCCALSPHPNIVKLVDIGLFQKHLPKRLHQSELGLGLVFDAFDSIRT